MNPRTCIGCRQRADAAELIRFVADPLSRSLVLPDPTRRTPGRGCHLHPRLTCYENAVRRRAFARALRLSTAVDLRHVVATIAPQRSDDDLGS